MPGNAIYRVVKALGKVEAYQFPFELNPATRAELQVQAGIDKGQRGADERAILQSPAAPAALQRLTADVTINPALRTTCVATMISGGHAPNALPAKVEANVNCRILPGHTQEEVRRVLIGVIGDREVKVQYKDDARVVTDTAPDRKSAPPPPPMAAVFGPLKTVADAMWPGVAIVPGMVAGASDSIYTTQAGMPSYGIAGMAMDRDENRAHGRDERIKASDFDAGCEFFYRYLRALTESKK